MEGPPGVSNGESTGGEAGVALMAAGVYNKGQTPAAKVVVRAARAPNKDRALAAAVLKARDARGRQLGRPPSSIDLGESWLRGEEGSRGGPPAELASAQAKVEVESAVSSWWAAGGAVEGGESEWVPTAVVEPTGRKVGMATGTSKGGLVVANPPGVGRLHVRAEQPVVRGGWAVVEAATRLAGREALTSPPQGVSCWHTTVVDPTLSGLLTAAAGAAEAVEGGEAEWVPTAVVEPTLSGLLTAAAGAAQAVESARRSGLLPVAGGKTGFRATVAESTWMGAGAPGVSAREAESQTLLSFTAAQGLVEAAGDGRAQCRRRW